MDKSIAIARCHEIQLAIKGKEVARFETIPEMGMALQLALHIRGLPLIDYELVKLVATTVLGIPRLAVDRIVLILEKIEFIRIQSEGKRIKAILPTVPYFDDIYDGLGDYLEGEAHPSEFEKLTLSIVNELAGSPSNIDALANKIGAERKDFNQSIEIGTKGSFLISRRSRAKEVIINPTYFSENSDIYADHVAKCGANTVKRVLDILKKAQGWPLPLIVKYQEIAGVKLSADEVSLIKRLAQDGVVKPPSIVTSHAGQASFIFSPSPSFSKISPLLREQYERGLAIVSAVRQGELLPNRYKIRSPGAVLYKLKTELKLRATSDYSEQYKNLVYLKVARLVKLDGGYTQLQIIDTPENRRSLEIAYKLVQGDTINDLSIDTEAINAMLSGSDYVESLVSARMMRENESIKLSDETESEVTQLLLEGF